MPLTPEQLRAVFPKCDAETWAPAITAAWARFGIVTRNARAGYLGIIGNETGALTQIKRELMNYSPSRARTVFGSTRANRCVQYCTLDESGTRVRYDNGKAFGSCIYAGMLGNGDESSGDGWEMRGVGLIQLTGRSNQEAIAKIMGLPVKGFGDLIASDPTTNAASAAAFVGPYAGLLPLLNSDSESDFLGAANRVGKDPDGTATINRLHYRSLALAALDMGTDVVTGAGTTPPAAVPRTLRTGDTGDDVRALQRALNSQNADMLGDDGVFDGTVYLAVKRFQEARGLTVDGIVGPKTWAALV